MKHGRTRAMDFPSRRKRGQRFWAPATDRFSAAVTKLDAKSCWPWRGGKNGDGYGAIKVNGVEMKAHRYAWILANGPIPDGLHVLHSCDNPPCCNPSHLFLGTIADNNRDRHAKGRSKNIFPKGSEHPRFKVSPEKAEEMLLLHQEGQPQRVIAERCGVSRGHVSKVLSGKL